MAGMDVATSPRTTHSQATATATATATPYTHSHTQPHSHTATATATHAERGTYIIQQLHDLGQEVGAALLVLPRHLNGLLEHLDDVGAVSRRHKEKRQLVLLGEVELLLRDLPPPMVNDEPS